MYSTHQFVVDGIGSLADKRRDTPFMRGMLGIAGTILANHGSQRFDTGSAGFIARFLEDWDAKTFQQDLRPLKIFEHVDVYMANPGAETYKYKMNEFFGRAKTLRGGADDYPRVGVGYRESTANIILGGAAWEITDEDMRKAAMANTPLETDMIFAARRACEEYMNTIGWLGATTDGVVGFITNPNIPLTQAPAGASTFRDWARKTSAEILTDFQNAVSSIYTNTKGTRKATRVLLPLAQFQLLNQLTYSGTNPTQTLHQWIMNNKDAYGIDMIDGVPELEGAGPSGTDMMLVYEKAPDVVQFIVALRPTNGAPVQALGKIQTNMDVKVGGVAVRYPLGCALVYNI